MNSRTEADPAIGEAYRVQAAVYSEAMIALLEDGRHQAAALVAVQVVRSAALGLLAACAGVAAVEEDPIALLWSTLPEVRQIPALQQGANVVALHEDLTHYAYSLDADEAREVVDEALAFRAWTVAPETAALIIRPVR
ncbi:MAG TPA: hypothetical protein VHB98_10500 [Chloroflexota bacterium]|nr:hypothetical protein [Chloroflexota bacterium]